MSAPENNEKVLICMRADVKSPFTDNVPGVCSECEQAVYHRPHAKFDRLMCHVCYLTKHFDPNDEVQVTRQTLEETLMVLGSDERTKH